jgi:hypothetical protein
MATIESILEKYEEKVSGLGYQTRTFLFEELKGIMEYPDLSANIVGYGYGPGYKATICTIIPSKKGIKLGFYKGSALPDPAKILGGSGKVHRHVELKSEGDLKNPALKQLITEALKAYNARSKAAK